MATTPCGSLCSDCGAPAACFSRQSQPGRGAARISPVQLRRTWKAGCTVLKYPDIGPLFTCSPVLRSSLKLHVYEECLGFAFCAGVWNGYTTTLRRQHSPVNLYSRRDEVQWYISCICRPIVRMRAACWTGRTAAGLPARRGEKVTLSGECSPVDNNNKLCPLGQSRTGVHS